MENINLKTTALEKSTRACEAVITAFAIQGQLAQTKQDAASDADAEKVTEILLEAHAAAMGVFGCVAEA